MARKIILFFQLQGLFELTLPALVELVKCDVLKTLTVSSHTPSLIYVILNLNDAFVPICIFYTKVSCLYLDRLTTE